ncbi:hypothetical protein CONPUDRAFT_154134 [Coniophora puteana RWD-64-598 SS2]|uniref:Uncharacterized protein n=1 Tax=Coniophora puteana (strain RWD-64-598) TaxID=741705 RepID=A0A5M3MQZ6_CONPW|nr:uncharacterized protein CONPUDRAFT_154134 [Coniophora puteana RWD-64-598 SS2]EIW81603.1 hypothetical protein CONPUDRAFT_154134 [Coniophora puteana RWD-64-598 SS2]
MGVYKVRARLSHRSWCNGVLGWGRTQAGVLLRCMATPMSHSDLFSVPNAPLYAPISDLVWIWSIKHGFQAHWALGGLRSSAISTPSSSIGGGSLYARQRVMSDAASVSDI